MASISYPQSVQCYRDELFFRLASEVVVWRLAHFSHKTALRCYLLCGWSHSVCQFWCGAGMFFRTVAQWRPMWGEVDLFSTGLSHTQEQPWWGLWGNQLWRSSESDCADSLCSNVSFKESEVLRAPPLLFSHPQKETFRLSNPSVLSISRPNDFIGV